MTMNAEPGTTPSCRETGCNDLACEHLTWGPPYCLLCLERESAARSGEPRDAVAPRPSTRL